MITGSVVQLTIVDINVYDTGVQAGSMMIRKLQNPDLLIQSYTTLPVIIPVSYTHLDVYKRQKHKRAHNLIHAIVA